MKMLEPIRDAMTFAVAVPTSTESVVFLWLKIAGMDVFKQMSKLVKQDFLENI